MQKKIQIFMEQYHMIENGDHVVAGVSGGADSVCLLRVLCELRECMGFSLSAVHVEHGIRGAESLSDAAFVRELCAALEVPLLSFSVDAPGRAGARHQSLEEAARDLRYESFYAACRQLGANRLAVAHHGDDCAETLLFHLSRGTGIRGLCGIVPVRKLEQVEATLIRPLLCLTREEIEKLLQDFDQDYRTDSTNLDENLSRNRIRSQVLPQLRQINSAAVPHMVRTAGYMEEVCAYLDAAAWEAGAHLIQYVPEAEHPQEIRIRRSGFADLPGVLQRNLLQRLLGELAGSRKDITALHVEQVQALFAAQVGKQSDLPYQMRAEAGYDEIYLKKKNTKNLRNPQRASNHAENTDYTEKISGNIRKTEQKGDGKESGRAIPVQTLYISGMTQQFNGLEITAELLPFDGNFQQIPEKTYTKWFDYDKIENTVQIRTRRPGDRIQVQSGGGHKKLKDYLIDSKIPQNQRDSLVLLADGKEIIWVVGMRISEAYKITQETKRILSMCVNGGEEKNE